MMESWNHGPGEKEKKGSSCMSAISNNTTVEIEGDNMKKYVGIWLDHDGLPIIILRG